MTAVERSPHRSPFPSDRNADLPSRTVPLLSTTSPSPMSSRSEPMDTSADNTPRAPNSNDSPGGAPQSSHSSGIQEREGHQNGNPQHPVGAAAAAQQPKAISAAFIHKLYSMLEDQSIQHLISWSSSNESFVMSPSTEFSKVLASYFKHTNISSFVRQLNMYGFHKGSPDSPLWEFKHGNNNFRRGDLNGLRDIKRRASRHTLIHRDSFSNAPKMSIQPPPPPPPGAPMEPMPDPVETRLSMLEFNLQDLYARLARTEEAFSNMSSKCQMLSEGLSRCHYWSSELSSQLIVLVPDPDNSVHKDVSNLRAEINRQAEIMRLYDGPTELGQPGRPPFAQTHAYEAMGPVSPRQQAYDSSRRPSLQPTSRTSSFRTPMPPHLLVSPRRYGSTSGPSGPNGSSSPSSMRPHPPANYSLPPPPAPQAAPQPQPQPATQQQHLTVAGGASPPMNLLRRHTSADIRLQGWQGPGAPPPVPALPNTGDSPYASGQNSSQWPSSPYRQPANAEDQQLRHALAQYEIPKGNSQSSRQVTPPPEHGAPSYGNPNSEGWQLPGPKFPFKGVEASAPPTRRSSMASNVHSLLNPTESAQRDGGEEGPEERKRKRLF
ncbi:hypothetical protein AAFC00_001408 [Neodothiora populina]|uniref:HSF-type DNA-binding domain-containing protein n=1 Tax=Neodothiora populina TaxID=2781224 RepID=A0ABR3PP37_9PEZI